MKESTIASASMIALSICWHLSLFIIFGASCIFKLAKLNQQNLSSRTAVSTVVFGSK